MQEYADLGIETFILSGYPHLEEAYRVADLLFPHLPVSSRSERSVRKHHWPVRRTGRQRISAAHGRGRTGAGATKLATRAAIGFVFCTLTKGESIEQSEEGKARASSLF
jgi:hypothetical protein